MDIFSMFVGNSGSSNGNGASDTFEAFSSMDNFFETPKKEKKKTDKKATQSKKSTPKGADYDVTLPVCVRARGFTQMISGTGTKKVSEILAELFSQGYVEVSLQGCNPVYVGGQLFIETPNSATGEDKLLTEGAIVGDGMCKMPVIATDFGCDEDELSVELAVDRWIEVNPSYKGCQLYASNGAATPYFESKLSGDKEVELPITVFFDGENHTYYDGDFSKEPVTADMLAHKIYGDVVESEGVKVSFSPNADKSVYYVTLRAATFAKEVKKPFAKDASGTPAKTVAKKYKLPLTVLIATWGGRYELTADDFGGKGKVTLQEIKAYLSKSFKIFADNSRQLSEFYIEETNTLSLMFVSGKKGAEVSLPVGTFVLSEKESMKFSFSLPKIPLDIYWEIIEFFRKDLSREAAVKVCFMNNEYFLINMTKVATKGLCVTSLPEFLNGTGVIQVMEVHSHNTMPAFWSPTDDADEIYPGIFMVLGELDKELPSYKLRAGYNGVFRPLTLSAVFDVEEV